MDRPTPYGSQSPTNTSTASFTVVNTPSIVISPTEYDEPVASKDRRPSSQDDSESVRDSTQLIPSPKQRPPQWVPMILEYWAIAIMVLINLSLAVALEVGIFLSNKNNGFEVAKENIFDPIRPQFLLSFFPTLLVLPVAMLWRDMEWNIRWLHPYVVLSKGQAPATQSLLMDYIALGPLLSVGRSAKFKHWVVCASTVTGLSTFLFQPLAGSIFRLEEHPERSDYEARTITQIGLLEDDQLNSLNAFVAAAGFTQAAVYNGLEDPPFIREAWISAQFAFPEWFTVNASIILRNTPGIETTINCAIPRTPAVLTEADGSRMTLAADADENCSANVIFDASESEEQFGVVTAPCDDTRVDLQRVMFWFYRERPEGGQAQAVFCQPTIQLFEVELTMNVTTQVITGVHNRKELPQPESMAGRLRSGQAYNGVVFDTDGRSRIVQSRAEAIRSAISGTIYRVAGLQPQGIDSVFRDANGFLNLTKNIYTRHLSVAGKSIYFVDADPSESIESTLESTVPRLVIDPLAGHTLAFFLTAIAIAGLVLNIKHRRLRRTLYLASPPGSMATVLSMTSRSGFGELLLPYDTEPVLKRKLDGLRFRLDDRTGAIVVDESAMDRMPSGRASGRSEAMMSLLGKEDKETRYSSSAQARQSATALSDAYPPTVPYRTPYDAER